MRIEDLRVQERGALARVAATVRWETSARSDQDVYYELPLAYADLVAPLPEAFLTLATMPAMRLGEERITVDGDVCPDLVEGLHESMAWVARWFPRRRPVRMDVEQGCSHARVETRSRAAGALMSGGVDGLSLIRFNHDRFPEGHRRRIGVGVVVRGLWGAEPAEADDAPERLARASQALESVAQDAGITLIPVFTNLHVLSDADMPFWHHEYQGAALASFGHVLARRLHALSIASTWDIAHLTEWGSHPVLDRNYSSHDLEIRHEMARWSRPAKLRLLARWPAALRNLRVCNRQPEADRNCGRCEKCVRTMLMLLALGVLDQADTFVHDDLRPEQLRGIYITHADGAGDYRETAALLRDVGRDDLAAAIDRRLRVSPFARRVLSARSSFARVDSALFHGFGASVHRRLRSSSAGGGDGHPV